MLGEIPGENRGYFKTWAEALRFATKLMNEGKSSYTYKQGALYYVTTFKGSDKFIASYGFATNPKHSK